MKFDLLLSRGARVGLSFLMLCQVQMNSAWALNFVDTGPALLPIETNQNTANIIDELFKPSNANRYNPADLGPGFFNPNLNPNGNTGANGPGLPNNGGFPNNGRSAPEPRITTAYVDQDFRCNLFENVPFESILSAVNSLNQAMNSPSCADSKLNLQSITENNKTIVDAINKLQGFKDNPETIQADNVPDIVAGVDAAIRAATTVANSFAQTDMLKKECRQTMDAGGIAVAMSEILNGLTPYALMAASFPGATVAVPYIVGASIITRAVGSMAKIVGDNSANMNDPQIRRAVVENACQYIRLDQKYKFLIKSRQEQISKITADLENSQRLFSAKVEGLSGDTTGLIGRKNILSKAALGISDKISSSRLQLESDKQFMTSTSDDIKICQLGIQMGVLAQNKTSYVATMLSTLDDALAAYGTDNIAQAQALKVSSSIAMKQLQSVAAKQFSGKVNFNQCAQVTKSFVETIEQSATAAKQLVKFAQDSIEKSLQGNKEYGLFKARLMNLDQKRFQAERVMESLDNLKASASDISQSEINSEMDRLRRSLFQSSFMGGSSPVLQWFKYVKGLHSRDVTRFQEGLKALRLRAFRMTKSANALVNSNPSYYPIYFPVDKKQWSQDQKDAQNLVSFNLQTLPLGTQEHEDACRELNDVWDRWTVAVSHLAAMSSFCGMIEPYVYDTRPEDQDLVMMCRGYSAASARAGYPGPTPSILAKLKDELVKSGTRDWALFIKQKIDSLVCLDTNPGLN